MDRLDSRLTFREVLGTFAPQVFTFSTEVVIESSYDNLTDTAKVIIPKKIKYQKEDGTPVDSITRGEDPLFKIGNEALIEVGYNAQLNEVFRGYVSGVRQKFPLELMLEDEVYQLKKTTVTVSLNNPSLEELLGVIFEQVPGVTYQITANQNLGKFRITSATPAQVLDELRKKHGIYSFFREGVLYVGLAVNPSLQTTHTFNFFTPDIITADNLTYIDASERKIKIVCKSIADDNTTLEASAGDSDGETRTFYFNNYTLQGLQDTADRLVNEYRYSGYDGYFTTFVARIVKHGDIVRLINPEIPEQSGGYIVDRVATRFGWSTGGRQDIYIKQKIYDLDAEGNEVPITQ